MSLRLSMFVCLTIFLAGCSGVPADDSGNPIRVEHWDPCPLQVDNCDKIQRDVRAAYHISGRSMDATTAASLLETWALNQVAIDLVGVDRDIVLEDLRINGYATGIRIRGICDECTITIRNITIDLLPKRFIDISPTGIPPLEQTAIKIEGGAFNVLFQNVSVRVAGGGTRTVMEGGGSNTIGGGNGIMLMGETVNVTMRTIVLDAAKENVGTALQIWSNKTRSSGGLDGGLSMSEIKVSGYDSAIFGQRLAIDGKAIHVDCGREGLDLELSRSFHVQGLHIHGCKDTALTVASSGDIKITTFSFSDSKIGAYIYDSGRGDLLPTPNVLQDGVVMNNTYLGIMAVNLDLRAERLEFRGNGQGDAVPNDEEWLTLHPGGIAANGGVVTIRDSIFEGNQPYGTYMDANHPLDARGNWWGSPDGPTVRTNSPLGDLSATGGDAVNEWVAFSPHLTERPRP